MTDNTFTKFIIHGPAEELPYVVDLLNEAMPMFRRSGGRLGWGWHLSGKGGPTYFVREIKGGLSAARHPKATLTLLDEDVGLPPTQTPPVAA